ncbi:MAG: 7-cyano-7-deazaguanine synthase QueC [Elusimicrobium sp.]|jgi:7-cyano-7-deazaguanine synthase|nr:7-cyano-7-deazaguanine synthase QueC [Elusimicrobium sp.]
MKVKIAASVEDCAAWAGSAVVIDVLRSSTTVCALLSAGKKDIVLYGDKNFAAALKRKNPAVEIFSELEFPADVKHKDNSPFTALKSKPSPQAVIVTTAGTPAIMTLKKAKNIFMGGFCNFSALAAHLKKLGGPVLLVPSNIIAHKEHLEDDLCAQSFKRALTGGEPDCAAAIKKIKQSARFKKFLYGGPKTAAQDAEICLAENSLPLIPRIILNGNRGAINACRAEAKQRRAAAHKPRRSEAKTGKKAVILFSGGMDSTVCLYWAQAHGYECHTLTISYGQKHEKEVSVARALAAETAAQTHFIKLSMPWLAGATSLAGGKKIPSHKLMEIGKKLPSTYVPARNLVFVSLAASLADSIGAEAVVLGPNAVDFSGYPDCTPQFYAPLTQALKTGTRLGKNFKLLTPLIKLRKAEIIKLGRALNAPLEKTWSCYNGGKTPCGKCDACKLRAQGFKQAKEK